MQIIEVKNKNQIREFLDLPRKLYKRDANWVCPLENDIESVFDPRKNNFHANGSCVRWILINDQGRTIGRIAAFINNKKAHTFDEPTGGCGFFECIHSQEAANLLFDSAKEWLISGGMKAMQGPINFGENDMWWGLLIEGYSRPYYGMNYNPPYYIQLFENYGFRVSYEQISNRIDLKKDLPERFIKIANWVVKRKGNSFDYLHKNNFDKYARDFLDIYNDGWKDFDHFSPLTYATIRESFDKMKPILDEKLIWFAYVNGEPVSFVMILPDTNELIDGLDGKLDLLGKLKFIWTKLTVKHKRMRAVIMGTKEKYRNQGMESALFLKLREYVFGLGHYEELELSWVGDFNKKMLSLHESTGATFAKRHATYQYDFDR